LDDDVGHFNVRKKAAVNIMNELRLNQQAIILATQPSPPETPINHTTTNMPKTLP
jgi:hypothetical protein